MQLRIGLEAGLEALQILEAKLLGDDLHLSFILFHLVEADLVNLVRGQIRGRCAAYEELVVLCPVGQGGDSGLLTSGGNIGDLEKAREALVGGQHLLTNRVHHFGLDALLFRRGNRRWKVLQGHGQWRVLRLLIGQLLHLIQRLRQQELGRDSAIVDADGHVGGYLVEGFGEGAQPSGPIVVVLDGGEAEFGH